MKLKHLKFLFLIGLGIFELNAQEVLSPLTYNLNLYREVKQYIPINTLNLRVIEDKNIIYTDTVNLPFFDEFSSNKLRPYKFLKRVPDSIVTIAGPCLAQLNIPTEQVAFNYNPTYYFSYNKTTKSLDSFQKTPITIRFYDSTNHCFDTARLFNLYTRTYRPTIIDSAKGIVLDSIETTADTLLYCAKIQFFHSDTNLLWLDNYAYINNTLPLNPPSIGVATLDGLNEYGLPYNKTTITAFGIADYLTSKPIKLAGLGYNDSVFISFYYQAKGLGDGPNLADSLILEFRDQKGNWNKVWYSTGYPTESEIPDTFSQVIFRIPTQISAVNPQYYFNGFQFRFKNYASLTGNNDHWHIDYVQLDKNKSYNDTTMDDVAFMYPVPFILKDYTQKPADHFDPLKDLLDTILVPNRDNDKTTFSNNYSFKLENTNANSVLFSVIDRPYGTSKYKVFDEFPKLNFNIPKLTDDSLVLKSTFWMGNNIDICASNDTTRGYQIFHNILAYDDGTAEKAYGLQGNGLKKFAYQFDMSKKDTLAGFMIHYTNIDENVSKMLINLYVWDTIQMGGSYEHILSEKLNKSPNYIDSFNSFAVYVLDTPLIVSNKFYLGWTQTELTNLQIGYDVNSKRGRSKMKVFSNGSWKESTVNLAGSPMIRAIIDGNFKYSTKINSVESKLPSVAIYPNPFQNEIQLINSEKVKIEYTLYDALGGVVKQGDFSSDISIETEQLKSGIYFIQCMQFGQIIQTQKLIKF